MASETMSGLTGEPPYRNGHARSPAERSGYNSVGPKATDGEARERPMGRSYRTAASGSGDQAFSLSHWGRPQFEQPSPSSSPMVGTGSRGPRRRSNSAGHGDKDRIRDALIGAVIVLLGITAFRVVYALMPAQAQPQVYVLTPDDLPPIWPGAQKR